MTETEWLACEDPTPMLCHVYNNANNRKMRLFACACCRRFWSLAPDTCRELIEFGERYADKRNTDERITKQQITDAQSDCQKYARGQPAGIKCAFAAVECLLRSRMLGEVMAWASRAVVDDARDEQAERGRIVERRVQIVLMRDIFGNPFHPITLSPSWLTSTVVALAQGIYEDRAFDRMPILADALMDAGCSNEDILNHCRGPGPHTRGCFAIDLILGKE